MRVDREHPGIAPTCKMPFPLTSGMIRSKTKAHTSGVLFGTFLLMWTFVVAILCCNETSGEAYNSIRRQTKR